MIDENLKGAFESCDDCRARIRAEVGERLRAILLEDASTGHKLKAVTDYVADELLPKQPKEAHDH